MPNNYQPEHTAVLWDGYTRIRSAFFRVVTELRTNGYSEEEISSIVNGAAVDAIADTSNGPSWQPTLLSNSTERI